MLSSICKIVRLESDSWQVPHQKTNRFIGCCHPYAMTSASKSILGRMQLALQATRPTLDGTSRLIQSASAWSVQTRRAPSRHGRDARVYGHTTTTMHDMSTPPPIPCDLWSTCRCRYNGKPRHGRSYEARASNAYAQQGGKYCFGIVRGYGSHTARGLWETQG